MILVLSSGDVICFSPQQVVAGVSIGFYLAYAVHYFYNTGDNFIGSGEESSNRDKLYRSIVWPYTADLQNPLQHIMAKLYRLLADAVNMKGRIYLYIIAVIAL